MVLAAALLITNSMWLVRLTLRYVCLTLTCLILLSVLCSLVALTTRSGTLLTRTRLCSMLCAALVTLAMTVVLWFVSVPNRSDPLVPGCLVTIIPTFLCNKSFRCVLVCIVLSLVTMLPSRVLTPLLERKLTLLLGKLTVVLMQTCKRARVLIRRPICVENVFRSEPSVEWVVRLESVLTRLVTVLVRVKLSPLPRNVCLENLLG